MTKKPQYQQPKRPIGPSDKVLDEILSKAGVGGDRIDLRSIGRLNGMNLYVDVGQQTDPELAFKLATALLFRAFVSRGLKT